MNSRRIVSWLLIILLGVAASAVAITTVPVEVVCPVCQTKNNFFDYASWGSYIYSYPSKFQLIFFPHTWSATIYSCKKCHLSLYMWDFKKFPEDKIAETARLLEPIKLSGEYKAYTDIPASEKLLIAEKVYRLLGRDDEFWNHFYRVLGYYCAKEGKADEAAAARRHALEIVQRMLQDPANAGHKKDLLVISASMYHFTGDDFSARNDLQQATALKFSDEKLGEERSKNYDAYLSSLITEFTTAIDSGKVPDDSGH